MTLRLFLLYFKEHVQSLIIEYFVHLQIYSDIFRLLYFQCSIFLACIFSAVIGEIVLSMRSLDLTRTFFWPWLWDKSWARTESSSSMRKKHVCLLDHSGRPRISLLGSRPSSLARLFRSSSCVPTGEQPLILFNRTEHRVVEINIVNNSGLM